MLRYAKITLIWTVALWGFLGAVHNFMDWNGTLGAVTAVTSMSTFDGGADSWQASTQPLLVWVGALFIVFSKLLVAFFCAVGGWKMWLARAKNAGGFDGAKETALVGCAVAVIMLFGGFIVIAESWYELWRSDLMRGPVLESAFRYAGMIALIGIFVGMKDDHRM
jgi:predicted small integral membrane protein